MSLYAYQEEGVDFLLRNRRAYLADEMGLGKAVQAAAAAARVRPAFTTVVAPASSLENWHREWETWGPAGGTMEAISWASLVRRGWERTHCFDLVILDEAHYAKNPEAKRTLEALNMARRADRAWLLSGTPMPNHPGELWAPIRALWPGRVPREVNSRAKWFNHFCKFFMGEWGPRVYGTKNADDLRDILQGIMFGRKESEVEADLPPLRIHLHRLPHRPLDPELASLAERVDLEAGRDDPWASASRLRRYVGELKAPQVAKVLTQELLDGQYGKVVVMAYHHSVLAKLREALAPLGVTGFDGRTPVRQRQGIVDQFTADPKLRVFVGQQSAAGIAINLQAASEVVLVEPEWSPDPNRQALKRIHRVGQTRPCRARLFAVAGTLDEAIMASIARKTQMQEEVGV